MLQSEPSKHGRMHSSRRWPLLIASSPCNCGTNSHHKYKIHSTYFAPHAWTLPFPHTKHSTAHTIGTDTRLPHLVAKQSFMKTATPAAHGRQEVSMVGTLAPQKTTTDATCIMCQRQELTEYPVPPNCFHNTAKCPTSHPSNISVHLPMN